MCSCKFDSGDEKDVEALISNADGETDDENETEVESSSRKRPLCRASLNRHQPSNFYCATRVLTPYSQEEASNSRGRQGRRP